MSTKYRNSEDVPTEVLVKRLHELSDAIVQRMRGNKHPFESEFTCRIPCELDRDPDMVLCTAATRLNSQADEITRLKERVEELKRENEAKDTIIKAVAHIGIDWGYGSYELESKFIDQARALYEKNEKRQDPSLQPTLESRL